MPMRRRCDPRSRPDHPSHRPLRLRGRGPLCGALLLAAGLAVAPFGPAAAQTLADYDYEHLTFRGIGFAGGYTWSDRIQDTEQYSVRFDLGYLGPGVRIVPSITFWQSELEADELDELGSRISQRTGSVVLGSELAPIEWSDISLAVDGHFVWSVPFGLLTYVGVGIGLHALNGQGPAVDDTFVEDLLDDITAGANGIVGIEHEPVGRIRIYAEGRYTAMSSLRYAVLRGGVQILLSRGDVSVGTTEPVPGLDEGTDTP